MRKQHRFSKIFWGVLIFLFVIAFTASLASAKDQYIRLGCGGPGGSWFKMVGGLSSLYNKKIEKSRLNLHFKQTVLINRLSML